MNVRAFGLIGVALLAGTLAAACSPVFDGATPTSSQTTVAPATTTAPAPVPSVTQSVSTQAPNSLEVCGKVQDHLYEACAAYVWNDAHFSLQPYYKYVHSTSLFSGLANRLELKYTGTALQLIQQRAANWPRGTNTVDGPDIAILSAQSSLACNRAVLVTRENWTVRTANGQLLYQENGQLHTIMLQRTPDQRFEFDGYVLHQWVVAAIYDGRQNLSVC